jgi:hypothetical protein
MQCVVVVVVVVVDTFGKYNQSRTHGAVEHAIEKLGQLRNVRVSIATNLVVKEPQRIVMRAGEPEWKEHPFDQISCEIAGSAITQEASAQIAVVIGCIANVTLGWVGCL